MTPSPKVLLLGCTAFLIGCVQDTVTESDSVTFSVSEGTGFSASLSPNGRMLAMDLQGQLWLLPAAGGVAEAVTNPLDEARYPDWSPDGRRIAFQAYTESNFHIWSISADGSDLRQHTSGGFDDREPSWSPAGDHILFASDRNGNFDLYRIDLSSGTEEQLTTSPAEDYFPVWSPDGSRIAFVRNDAGSFSLMAMPAAGGEASAIATTRNPILHISWHPSGDHLTFFTYTRSNTFGSRTRHSLVTVANGEITPLTDAGEDVFPGRVQWKSEDEYLYTADGGIRVRSTSDTHIDEVEFSASFTVALPKEYERKDHQFHDREDRDVLGILRPEVTPDGSQIAFTALGDIWLHDVDESGPPVQVTNDAHLDVDPTFSRDGRYLAYLSDKRGTGTMDLYILDRLSGETRRVTETEDDLRMPSWSPNSKSIAVLMRDSRDWHAANLHIVDVDSGELSPVYDGSFLPSEPSWSPDGRRIVMAALSPSSRRFRKGENQFLSIDVETGTARFLTNVGGHSISTRSNHGPVWSPDGTKIVYVFDGQLWYLPVTGDGSVSDVPVRLTEGPGEFPSWTADSQSIVYLAVDEIRRINLETGQDVRIHMDMRWRRAIPQGTTIVRAGRLFDGVSPEYLEDVDIVLEGNRIVEISPHEDGRNSDRYFDASGYTVIPGLFQMHIHHFVTDGEKDGRNWLAYGITSIREPGADPYEALERRESWDSGSRIGPRSFYSPILEGRRLYYWMNVAIASSSHLERELEKLLKLDADFIKTYERLSHRYQKQITEFAHRHGLAVASHEIYPAAQYGVDVVEHLATNDKLDHSDRMSFNRQIYSDVVEIMKHSGMAIVPTSAGRSPGAGYIHQMSQMSQVFETPQFRSMPRRFRESARQLYDWQRNYLSESVAFVPNELASIRRLVDRGVKLSTGTDGGTDSHGYTLILEIKHIADAGLGNFAALKAATIEAAHILGVDPYLGSIEPGKLADFVILDGDPLAEIGDLLNVASVVRDGNYYTLEELLVGPPVPSPNASVENSSP